MLTQRKGRLRLPFHTGRQAYDQWVQAARNKNPKKELYVCWERAATSKKCFLNHKNIPAQFINT